MSCPLRDVESKVHINSVPGQCTRLPSRRDRHHPYSVTYAPSRSPSLAPSPSHLVPTVRNVRLCEQTLPKPSIRVGAAAVRVGADEGMGEEGVKVRVGARVRVRVRVRVRGG